MVKEFKYRGKNLQELQQLSLTELAKLLPSRQRRTIIRGFSDDQKHLIKKLETKNTVKTHLRNMIVLPQWVGKIIRVHSGKEYVAITIMEEMIGMKLGELSSSRKLVRHSAPGVGATRSSASLSVK